MAKKPSQSGLVPSLCVEDLLDALSSLPRPLECPKCASSLQYREAVFSHNGQVWTLQLPVCPNCDLEHDDADTSAAA